MNFRPLRADEINCRVQQAQSSGVVLLLYKDARCDMAMLDEAAGAENWQCRYYECKGNLFCSVGIKIDGEWVFKDNCGTESNAEAEKGEASDAFKRACFNWGIGRELYTAPYIKVPAINCAKLNATTRKDKWGKAVYECKDYFKVSEITIQNGKITSLQIQNTTTNQLAYSFGDKTPQWSPQEATGEDLTQAIKNYCLILEEKTGRPASDWQSDAEAKYHTQKAQAQVLVNWIKKVNEKNENA